MRAAPGWELWDFDNSTIPVRGVLSISVSVDRSIAVSRERCLCDGHFVANPRHQDGRPTTSGCSTDSADRALCPLHVPALSHGLRVISRVRVHAPGRAFHLRGFVLRRRGSAPRSCEPLARGSIPTLEHRREPSTHSFANTNAPIAPPRSLRLARGLRRPELAPRFLDHTNSCSTVRRWPSIGRDSRDRRRSDCERPTALRRARSEGR